MQVNQKNLQDLYKGFNTLFNGALASTSIYWKDIASEITSTNMEEHYPFLGAFPALQEIIGETKIQNLTAYDWTIKNKPFSSIIEVGRAEVETDNYHLYNFQFQMMGRLAAKHPDTLVSGLLAGGFTNKCYTGKNFFDTGHEPVKGGTKFTNKATYKLSAASFAAARASMVGRVDGNGIPYDIGDNLRLVVAPENEALADTIVTLPTVSGGGANPYYKKAMVHVMRELSGANADKWFLLETGFPVRPLIVQMEKRPTFTSQTTDASTHVFLTEKFLYKALYRGNAGYALPELAWGSTGADAAL